ncbi:MAG TPA: hypothetical protein VGF39_03825 [Stellaceae bacterium]|jgi:hypothetical protein
MRRRYVMRNGELVPWEPPAISAARSDLPAPTVQTDLAPYRSMRTGELITGRTQHREHLRRYDLTEVGNEASTIMAPRKLVEPAAGEIAQDIKRQLDRDPGERRAEAEGVLRGAGYEGPQIDRVIGGR